MRCANRIPLSGSVFFLHGYLPSPSIALRYVHPINIAEEASRAYESERDFGSHHVTVLYTVASYPSNVTVRFQRLQTSLVILHGARGPWRETIHFTSCLFPCPVERCRACNSLRVHRDGVSISPLCL
jgi:hypothetical protein